MPYPWQKTKGDREWGRRKLEWTGWNLPWIGGQLKLPNGSDQKLVSRIKTILFQFSRFKLNCRIVNRLAPTALGRGKIKR